jgi:hypothetical protein
VFKPACFLPTLVVSTDPQSPEETDVLVHHTLPDGSQPLDPPTPCPATELDPSQRQRLALDALTGSAPIARIAQEHHVSRKFIYHQAHKAQQALDHAFNPESPARDDRVLFYLPVTKAWIRQFVLALILICHSSFRGVTELLRDLFDYHLSVGTVHNIVDQAVATARQINLRQDLSRVRIGADDEIFQSGRPVLVGVDTESTYCYLLRQEEHRDADTWGLSLLELVDRGFAPEATIADFGSGLRAGHEQALPGIACRGDVFHAFYELGPLVRYLENRAYEAIDARTKLERKQAAAERRKGRKKPDLAQKIRSARQAEAKAIRLAEDVAVLARWLREDILAVAGPESAIRRALYDFVVAELRGREPACPHRIKPVRQLLENQREHLLAFAVELDRDLAALARQWQIGSATAREVLEMQALPVYDSRRWRREAALRATLRGRYHGVCADVEELSARVVRASSLVENLNSRLRNYFFLRRYLGENYLVLLQFFLNHRRYLRSEHPHRVGKSPTELLTGEPHRHWLELLGYTPYVRN